MRELVPQSIHGVFGAGGVGGDVADHDGVAVADEGVLEDHGKLAAAEGSVAFALVQGPDALLQRKQRFVDFSPIDLGLLALVHVVRASLVACQIDEGDLAVVFVFVLEADLEDGVGAGGVVVGVVLGGHPQHAALLDQVQKLLGAADVLLVQPDHVDVALVVLADVQHVPAVEQVVELAAVDLVEGHVYLQVSVLRLSHTSLYLFEQSENLASA